MKQLLVAVLLLTGMSYAGAQEVYTSSGKPRTHKKVKKERGFDPDRLILGGGLNLGFGNGYANVGASPIVGYRITNALSAGIGMGYQYYKAPDPYYYDPADPYKVFYDYEHIFYPSVWTRLFVYNNFFISSAYEFDFINFKGPGLDNFGNPITIKKNVTNPCLLVGAGFRQPLGGRVSAYFEFIYDVLQGDYSPYPKNAPDIRIGFAAGL